MLTNISYTEARDVLLGRAVPVASEEVSLEDCGGRILAEDVYARISIPHFDRSPYDGYAFRACDTANASPEHPVTLKITEEIPAGSCPSMEVGPGMAAKVLTGAPIPPGADTVIMYEKTVFTAETVTIDQPARKGDNIVLAGEDVKSGRLLAESGSVIDPGLAGTLAAQGICRPVVFRRPCIGLLSTGTELIGFDEPLSPGKIYDSNSFTLRTALSAAGFEVRFLGRASDSVDGIARLIAQGLDSCDAVVSTGGVSAGDYDLTDKAMMACGCEMLIKGVKIKPGMACAFGVRDGRLVCALSGNPASSMTAFYAIALPALKKLAGHARPIPQEISLRLLTPFGKKSPVPRFLRGRLELSGGEAGIVLSEDQGNVVLSSAIGCNAMAIVPAGSGKPQAGTVLSGFII